jgi:hypothetical protein
MMTVPTANILTLRAKKSLTVIIVMGLFLFNCTKKSDPIPETERVKQLLISSPWKVQTVTVDLVDQTPVYAGLTLSFTETAYTTTQGGFVWPASGTWVFADNTGKTISRSDGLSITVVEVTPTQLALKFTWLKGTLSGGKSLSVAGVHLFTFIK